MKNRPLHIALLALLSVAQACGQQPAPARTTPASTAQTRTIMKSDEEWKKELTPEQYNILRKQGTERPFTGAYWDNHEAGRYLCVACGMELFDSNTKFDSGTGWPSFYQPATKGAVDEHTDRTLGMTRTEVTCARCGGHLGHVFDDGPEPTGLRYCINSACLTFEPGK